MTTQQSSNLYAERPSVECPHCDGGKVDGASECRWDRYGDAYEHVGRVACPECEGTGRLYPTCPDCGAAVGADGICARCEEWQRQEASNDEAVNSIEYDVQHAHPVARGIVEALVHGLRSAIRLAGSVPHMVQWDRASTHYTAGALIDACEIDETLWAVAWAEAVKAGPVAQPKQAVAA